MAFWTQRCAINKEKCWVLLKAHSSTVVLDISESHSPPASVYFSFQLCYSRLANLRVMDMVTATISRGLYWLCFPMLGSLTCIWSINYNKRPAWCWMSDEVKSTCVVSVWLYYDYEWHDVCMCVSGCLHTVSPLLSWSRHTLMPGLVTFSTSDSHGEFPSLKLFWVYEKLTEFWFIPGVTYSVQVIFIGACHSYFIFIFINLVLFI